MNDIFDLEDEELTLVKEKNTNKNKLGFAVLLKHFQLNGRYPKGIQFIDPLLIKSLANQLSISEAVVKDFDWEGRSTERFRKEIRDLTGFKQATIEDSKELIVWLIKDIFPKAPKPSACIEFAYEYLYSKKTEPFTSNELEKYVQSAHSKFEQNLFTEIYNNLSKGTTKLIDQILNYDFNSVEEEEQPINNYSEIKFKHFKKDIPGAKLKNVLFEINKICQLRQLKLPNQILDNLSPKLIKKYYDRILAEPPGEIYKHKPKTRYASFALYCYFCSKMLIDNLADVLIQLIQKMNTSAESFINKKIIADVKHVNGKFDILYSLASASVANPDGVIKTVIYPQVSEETLKDLIKELKYKGKWYQNQVRTKIRSLYSHASRKILLTLLAVFEFKTNLYDSKPLLEAITLIKSYSGQSIKYYPNNIVVPIENVIPSNWLPLVETYDDDNITEISAEKLSKNNDVKPESVASVKTAAKINCFYYEIAVLEETLKQLKCKKIWIEGAHRYRNPDDDLPKDFDERREYYYKMMGLPLDPEDFIRPLKEQLTKSLKELNDSILSNKKVKIIDKKGGRIKISPYEPQADPPNIKKLHLAIRKKWPNLNLIDILKETDFQVGFTDKMHTVASREKLSKNKIQKRLLLALYAIGSNTGLKRMSAANGDVSYADLRYIKRKFITVANVKTATIEVVNKILDIRDPRIWGESTTSVICDSKKINAWDQNLMTEWHPRYKSKGIMVYWHVEKRAVCVNSNAKNCFSSEVGSMYKGILEHCTNMEIDKAYIDTHGQSTFGFGIGAFIHVDLFPRLKNINKQKLYYPSPESKKDYPNLQKILKAPINWEQIANDYNEAVKHAVALKLGIVEADVMVKRFSNDNYEHPVYKVFTEVGKAKKTIFLCNYIQSEELRIEIHEALNIVERVNSIMSFICYGKLGEISTNFRIDQELAIACLHLLQVAMGYINTILHQDILSTPEWEGVLTKEDHRALNILFHGNINPYGLFPLNLDTRLGVPVFNNENEDTSESEFMLEEID